MATVQRLILGCLVLCLQLTATLQAQDIFAFIDKLNYLYVFDNGQLTKLEHLPPQSFKVGFNYVAYVDNSGTFKLYRKGNTETISDFKPEK